MILSLEIILMSMVLIFGVGSLLMKDTLNAAIVFGAYSFIMCLIWTGMGAVDVAFTEAAVGAGVSTVFIIACIFNTSREIKNRSWDLTLKVFATVICVGVGALLLSGVSDFAKWGDPYSPANYHVSKHYVENAYKETKVPNFVTAVLADYRGFDTMFETGVVFVAGLAIFTLLRRGRRNKKTPYDKSDNLIIQTGSRLMIPMMQIFALYVVAHGHHSPGGGFQGGVILGASVILLALSFDLKAGLKRLSEKWIVILSALGLFLFAGAGAFSLLLGGNFLDYSVWSKIIPATGPIMARSHMMLFVEIGVALAVMCGMFGIYAAMSSDGHMDRGL